MRFSNRDYAGFYDMQQSGAGYPGMLLRPVLDALRGFFSVIDIGAGTGLFTIPLLESGHSVTVVEPASEMSDIIVKKCDAEKRKKLTVATDRWEDWAGKKHDGAICIHSIYSMDDRKSAVKKMLRFADKRIIIIRDSPGMKTLSGMTRIKLGIKLTGDMNSEIAAIIKSLEVPFTVEKIIEERPHRIIDLYEEAEHVAYQLGIDKSEIDRITDIITGLCEKDSNGILFNAVYSDYIYIF